MNVADYDAGSQEYVIEVVATDSGGLTGTVTVTVEVEPVNEFAPSVDPASPTSCTLSECSTATLPAICMEVLLADDDFNAHPHGQVILAFVERGGCVC